MSNQYLRLTEKLQACVRCAAGWSLLAVASLLFAGNPIIRVDTLTISAVGDIMVHDSQIASAAAQAESGYDFKPTFALIRPFLFEADLTLGNLETTLPGDPNRYSGYPAFGAPDDLAQALKWAGFDLLTTANNHALDKGRNTFIRTLNVLDTLGIHHTGTWRSEKEFQDNRVCLIHKKNFKLAFLNYTYGTNGIEVPQGLVLNLLDRNRMVEDLALARAHNPDAIIVLLHYGTEYKRLPTQQQKMWADLCIHEGADIVLGGHPHVVQPFEIKNASDKTNTYKPRLIMWSLGNFVSNQKRPHTDNGIIFHFSLIRTQTTDGRTAIDYKDIHYTPVHVHERKTGKHLHVIIPSAVALTDSAIAAALPSTLRTQLKNSLAATQSHLKSSMEQVRDFQISRKANTVSPAIF